MQHYRREGLGVGLGKVQTAPAGENKEAGGRGARGEAEECWGPDVEGEGSERRVRGRGRVYCLVNSAPPPPS